MLQIEYAQNFNGFGNGEQVGEYYHSQAMRRSRFGLVPGWLVEATANSTDLATLGLVKWFDVMKVGSTTYVLALDATGKLFASAGGVDPWTLKRTPNVSFPGFGNGMIVDQKGRVLYAGKRYLGMSSDLSAFTDDWKDFGANISPEDEWRSPTLYEDMVIFPNGNKLAALFVTDDSFNSNVFNLPDNYVIRTVRGNKNGILIGANINQRGVLVLWDGHSDRSTAPWIQRDGNILSIIPYGANWLVVTTREIIITDGYTAENFTEAIDSKISGNNFDVYPQGTLVIGDKLLIAQRAQDLNRAKPGFYTYDLKTKTFEFFPISTKSLYQAYPSALFFDQLGTIHSAYFDSFLNKYYIGTISNGDVAQAHFVTEALGQGNNEKAAEAIKLDVGGQTFGRNYKPLTFTISAKVYNFKRQLWMYGQTNALSSSVSTLSVDGSVSGYNKAQIGDEVTILQGVNAGEIRQITAIANQGTNTEVWTLDRDLSNLTETAVFVNVQPFQQIARKTITNATEIRDLYFNCKNKIKGRKFLTKFVVETTDAIPELHQPALIYDDLGVTSG